MRSFPVLILLLVTACRPVAGTAVIPVDPLPALTSTPIDAPAHRQDPAPAVLVVPPPTSIPALSTLTPAPAQLLIAASPMAPPALTSPARPCPVPLSGGLISELRPVLAAIPGPGTQAMLVPSQAQMVAWEFLVRSMAEGELETACQVLLAFDFPYTLLDFTDLPEANARYLALVEDTPVAYGWGTYVVRSGPADTEAVFQVPHPIADDRTALQGADLFRRLKARALMIAGAHRCTNSDFSPCSGTTVACGQLEPYRSSDVAHAAQTAFQAAHKALVPCGGARLAVQLHGNGLAACPDLFISNGTLNPRRTTLDLYASAARRCSGYSAGLADGLEGECAFNGGATVQAVYSNGCALTPPPDACTGYAESAPETEPFIFLEQSMRLRRDYGCLVKALEEALGE